ncbi:MAG: PDZ domain-containing protein [Alcanivorax sp.]
MKLLTVCLAMVMVAGCASSGYSQFYKPHVDASTLPDVELLGPEEEPEVYTSDDLAEDIYTLRSKRYIAVGYSSFNGSKEDVKKAANQAKNIGATVVLVKSKYTGTQANTSALYVPNTQTTYHSGTVYGGGAYGSYSGTSTTYGTTVIPYTSHQRRYDQVAVYFVRSTKKFRIGVFVNDLSPELRAELGRNTGAIIDVVIEDTPAFYSNIVAGDILISIDGTLVKNARHALEIMNDFPESKKQSTFYIIRKGEEREVEITL